MLLKTLFALTLCVIGSAQAQKSPVFLWGAPTDAKHSLATISKTDFTALLTPLLEKNTIIAFLEDNLSARDLSCHNLANAGSCYAHLRSVQPKTYYASVEQPIDVLRQITGEHEHNSVDATGKLALPIDLKPGKVIFVSFDTTTETQRGRVLEAHDAAIEAISKQLTGDVVYLYLSSSTEGNNGVSLASRVRRDTAAPNGGQIFRDAAQLLLYFSNFQYLPNGGTAKTDVVFDTMTVQNTSATVLTVTLTGAKAATPLAFLVQYSGGYYAMINVTYDNLNFYYNDMTAPTTFSYHCGQLVLSAKTSEAVPNNARIFWSDLQFQAPFGKTTNASFVFGDSWDCVYFFTPAILSGLFVATIFLLVLFSGICWIMDINTMDRFDDPKGKTITINAD